MDLRTCSLGLASLLTVALAGCSKAPTPQPVKAKPAAEAKKTEEVETPPPLSEEDKRLIAADPATLTAEERRKRGYALRRKIMQNPDSPAARTLKDLARAAEEGTLDPNSGRGTVLHQAGSKPQGGAPPAGYRPPAEGEQEPAKPEPDAATP